MTQSIEVVVHHEAGLHARPLAQFVKVARQFDADIRVTNVTRQKGPANGKSPIKLMLLAVLAGHAIEISAEGNDAGAALTALRDLIDNNFVMPAQE